MSDDGLNIDTHAVRQTGHKFGTLANALRDKETNLRAQVQDLVGAGWQGTASGAFEDAYARFRLDTMVAVDMHERTSNTLFSLANQIEHLVDERNKAIAAGIGLGILTVGLTVINVMQLGLDPVTDGAEVATGAGDAADLAVLSDFLAEVAAIEYAIARELQEIEFEADQAGNVVGLHTTDHIPQDDENVIEDLERMLGPLGGLAANQQQMDAAEQQERQLFYTWCQQEYPDVPQQYIESMLDAGLNQAEIVQLLDRGFIEQYSSLFQTSAANPHGEEMVGVIASMAWANISPNQIVTKNLLDDAHLQVYAEELDKAYEAGQYVSIGDIASMYAAGVPIEKMDQLLADQFFSTYGDLIEIYGAGWLAKIRFAYRGSPNRPGTETWQQWFQEMEKVQDIPGAWSLAQNLASGNGGGLGTANDRWGAQFALQWLAANSDNVAAIEPENDSKQGPDAVLTDGTLVEIKSYTSPSSHLSGPSGMEAQLLNQHLPWAMDNGVTKIQYVFDTEFTDGKIPQSVEDRLQAIVNAWNAAHSPPHPAISISFVGYMGQRDQGGGFG